MGGARRGLLIVNADDYGLDQRTSEAIVTCLEAGAITSATAMVWMSDSNRAAAEFPGPNGSLGLHLNLIEPYAATDVPPPARKRQLRVADHFARSSAFALFVYNPRLAQLVNDCIADQLEAFRTLYGREPTHVDGHQHAHICANVLVSPALSSVRKLRPAFTFARAEKPLHKRAVRAVVNALIRRRFVTADRFHSIRTLAPELGGLGTERLGDASRLAIEVMTHPGWDDEFLYLRSDAWRAGIEGTAPLGTYADL